MFPLDASDDDEAVSSDHTDFAIALGDALGVHFHADVTPLLAGMSAFAAMRPGPTRERLDALPE